MRVVILVLSCQRPPYDALLAAQRRTWDSVSVEDVTTVYYFCDGMEEMTGRLREALRDLAATLGWDFVFRTNASSYVDKAALLDFSRGLPQSGCYCGIDGDGFASGSGFFLSPDAAEMLAEDLPDVSAEAEDVVTGRLLVARGVRVTPGAERRDYWHDRFVGAFRGVEQDEEALRAAYHVRCKADGGNRAMDVLAMEDVHRIKLGRRETP